MSFSTGENNGQLLFTGVYANPTDPIWTFNNGTNPANLEVSTITVNSYPAGNILLTHNVSSGVEYNAPLLFQRPPTDINAPVEGLKMNLSHSVPTKPVDGEFITCVKDNSTVFDDLALAGLQVFGNQTVDSPCIAYINGATNGDLSVHVTNGSVTMSSLKVSTLFANTVVSTGTGTANSYTASLFMSTPVLYADYVEAKQGIFSPALSTTNISTNAIQANNISTNYISTNNGYASSLTIRNANISSANISAMTAGNFGANRIDVTLLSSLTGDITFNLVSSLSLFGNVAVNPNINLGLGDVIQGAIGGAASQGLGVILGGAALVTGAVGLFTGRTSGGANPNVFQTVNGTTQLQFSTIGSAISSIFFDTNSPSPGVQPGVQTSTTIGIPAGAYCVRSVGDPLNLVNNVSTLQSFGQWVPVIQNNPTLPAFTTSSLTVSSLTARLAQISTAAISSISTPLAIQGPVTSDGTSAFSWGQTTLLGTSSIFTNAKALTLNVTSDSFVTQIFGNSANFTVVNGSNQVNGNFLNASSYVSTPRLNTSTLNAFVGTIGQFTTSSINGVVYPPPFEVPSTLYTSTINISGNLVGANSNAYISFPASLGPFPSTIIGPPGVLTNQVTTQFISCLGTASIGQANITLGNEVSSLIGRAVVSSLAVSTMASRVAGVSSMTVSTLNGQIYPPPGFGIQLPSTVAISTLTLAGNFSSDNPGAYSSWKTQGFPYPCTIIGGGLSGIETNQIRCAIFSGLDTRSQFGTFTTSLVLGDPITGGGTVATVADGIQSFTQLRASTLNLATSVTAPLVSTTRLNASTISFTSSLTSVRGSLEIGGPDSTGVTAGVFTPGGGLTYGRLTSPYMVVYQNLTNLGATNLNGSLSVTGLLNATSPLGASFNGPITTPAPITGTLIQATTNMTSPQITTQALGVQQTANISTGVISSLFTQYINGQPYPPQSGVTGATPSTMLASTVFINGGLTLTNGGMAITQGGISVSAGPVNISGGASLNVTGIGPNVINSANIGSISSVSVTGNIVVPSLTQVSTINGAVYPPPTGTPTFPSTLTVSTLFINGGLTNTGEAPFKTSTLSAVSINDVSSLSAVSITQVSTINGAVYPPPSYFIPSTLYTSTLLVNGGMNVSGNGINFFNGLSTLVLNARAAQFSTISSVIVTGNLLASTVFVRGGLTNTGVAPITTSTIQIASTILLSNTLGSANISYGIGGLQLTSADDSVTIKTGLNAYEMLNVEQLTGTPSTLLTVGDAILTYDKATTFCGTYKTYYSDVPGFTPAGSVITSNVSSVNVFASTINTNNLAAQTITGNLSAFLINTGNINVSSINNAAYPPFSLTFLVPTGSITIWAGGQETTLAQNFNVPPGWLTCDGSLIATSAYTTLASIIGTTYSPLGSSPPTGFVYLPDLTFAVPMGTPRKTFSSNTILPGPTIQITAYQSDSQYGITPFIMPFPPVNQVPVSTLTTWEVTTKIGGALNYGSYIPANSVSIAGTPAPLFPAMYVSSIIEYEGGPSDKGYILLRSCDGVTPIPKLPLGGSPSFQIQATFQGVAYGAQLPSGVDIPYKYGSANVEGKTAVTRNQGLYEVAPHNHQGVPDTNSAALIGLDLRAGNGGYSASNYLPYVSSPTGVSQNLAYNTAPNYLNLLWIIKY